MIRAPSPSEMPTHFMSDEENLVGVGNSAREHRLALNISQEDLAQHAGISRSCVRSFERGDSISTSNLVRILRSLRLLQNLRDMIPPVEVNMYQKIVEKTPSRRRATSQRKDK